MTSRKGGPKAPKAKGRAGKHASPRRQLLASAAQFESWDREAARLELTWAEWARQALDGASARADADTSPAGADDADLVRAVREEFDDVLRKRLAELRAKRSKQ